MKIISILGEPGSGKTTLMKKIINEFDINGFNDTFPLVPYHYCFQKETNKWLNVIGIYKENEVFGGTDKMSMACQPKVIEWLANIDNENYIVFFEGDRLGNQSFLEHCLNNYDLSIIYLKTSEEIRKQRFQERKSNQNKKWLQGRETKLNNILKNFFFIDSIIKMDNNTIQDHEMILDYIKGIN